MYVKKKSTVWKIVLIVCVASVLFGCRSTAKKKESFFEIRHNNELIAYGSSFVDMPLDGPYDMRVYVFLPKYAIDNFDAFDIYSPKTEKSFTVKTDKLKYWKIGESGLCVVLASEEFNDIAKSYPCVFNEMGLYSVVDGKRRLFKITAEDFCVSPQKSGKKYEGKELYRNFALLRQTIHNDIPIELREHFFMPKSSSKL
jgi:hypothetical protein